MARKLHKLFIIIFLTLAGILIIHQQIPLRYPSSSHPDWQTYRDTGGWQIQYPTNFELDTYSRRDLVADDLYLQVKVLEFSGPSDQGRTAIIAIVPNDQKLSINKWHKSRIYYQDNSYFDPAYRIYSQSSKTRPVKIGSLAGLREQRITEGSFLRDFKLERATFYLRLNDDLLIEAEDYSWEGEIIVSILQTLVLNN